MRDVESSVPVPRYNLKRVFALRSKLRYRALHGHYGVVSTGEIFEEFVTDIQHALPKVSRQAVFNSVHMLAGRALKIPDVYAMAWRLAGNIERLQAGEAVPPWGTQREPEWVPTQVLSFDQHKTASGKFGGIFRLRILAGTSCPMTLSSFWSAGRARLLAKQAGFTAPWHKLPFRSINELVNMRFMVLIEPKHCRPGRPGFEHIGCTGSMVKHNKAIMNLRMRRKDEKYWPCPAGFSDQLPCFSCPVGYTRCPAACHKDQRCLQDSKPNVKQPQERTNDSGLQSPPCVGDSVRSSEQFNDR